ncbi:hypothetical protein [Streptomyces sp900116325]|uniref:hypothetical protein n=1 Tax=Streptomyces sp. 900116325 TaxID=3154295 RepID=UPI0033A5032B
MFIPESDSAIDVIREAERTVINAKWHWCEARALEQLAAQPGLACSPLFPGHPVIQVVAYDGQLLGRVRRHTADGVTRWITVHADTAHELGARRSMRAAARTLARAAGKPHHRVIVHAGIGD